MKFLLFCHLSTALAISRGPSKGPSSETPGGVARFGPANCVSSFVNGESTCAPLQNS